MNEVRQAHIEVVVDREVGHYMRGLCTEAEMYDVIYRALDPGTDWESSYVLSYTSGRLWSSMERIRGGCRIPN